MLATQDLKRGEGALGGRQDRELTEEEELNSEQQIERYVLSFGLSEEKERDHVEESDC